MEKPFITAYSTPEARDMWNTQQVVQVLNNLNGTIQAGNAMMNHAANNFVTCVDARLANMDKKLDDATRKKRRACVSRGLSVRTDGYLILLETYDDGSQDAKLFAANLKGNWEVSRLKLKCVEDATERFLINFPECGITIIGDIRKVTGKNLLELFIKSGVKLLANLSEKAVADALFTTFAPLIENTTAQAFLKELAGWHEGKYYYRERLKYPLRSDFPRLPVHEKSFVRLKENREELLEFFQLYTKIEKWKNRLYILETQVIGILASVLAKEGLPINFFLNVVVFDEEVEHIFRKLLPIFNRQGSYVIDASWNEKEIRKSLMSANDEVVLVDATSTVSAYKKKKAEENVTEIAKKICKRGSSAFRISREIEASLVVLNHQRVCIPGGINILVDESFLTDFTEVEKLLNHTVVENFLSEFIRFAEKKMQDIRRIMQNEKLKKNEPGEQLFQTGFEILKLFCRTQGLDICQELGLPPKINFSSFAEEAEWGEDMTQKCVQIIRREMTNYIMEEKGYNLIPRKNVCYYNEEKVWIPTTVLEHMFGRNGMLAFKTRFLADLKEKGDLFADRTGLSMRMQIGYERSEFYVFRRSSLNRPGTVDIVRLGKEKKYNADGSGEK